MNFKEGQKVQFRPSAKLGVPAEWQGILTFVRYTGETVDSCLVTNGSGKLYELDWRLVSAEPSD